MDLAGMNEREYFAHMAKRLGMFVPGSRASWTAMTSTRGVTEVLV
jgi:hypothetical protein